MQCIVRALATWESVYLSAMNLVLASASPRRQELLRLTGIPFRIMVPAVDETYPEEIPIRYVASYLSEKKAESLQDNLRFNEWLVAADTCVLLDDRLLGKPRTLEEAEQMLADLSGRSHEVITGVTLVRNHQRRTFREVTRVHFRHLSQEFIHYYVRQSRPLDKAGAYGIQEIIGLVGVEKIQGCFFNVMGLPVSRLLHELEQWGFDWLPFLTHPA